MVKVKFTHSFEKQIQRQLSPTEAKAIVKNLIKTRISDGDFITSIADLIMKEKKIKSFRFYFVYKNDKLHFLSKSELKKYIITFVGLSKKNNQQHVIDKLKKDLLEHGSLF